VYLAIADDTVVRHATVDGISGTSMPAFAQSTGGMLTDKQIDVIVQGIRERWAQPDVLRGANPPPYSSSQPGDASRGLVAYAEFCSSCHGAGGRGGEKASSIVDGSFLALLNDQELRTIVIVGRPELGALDWRGNVPGKPMSPQDVSDVVAWLASLRAKFPGQPYPNSAKLTGAVQ
jgi:mono/diheme cytochrome c family protein